MSKFIEVNTGMGAIAINVDKIIAVSSLEGYASIVISEYASNINCEESYEEVKWMVLNE